MSVRNAASARAEPSWGRVLATTVRLWVQRRRTTRRWQLAAVFLALAVVAVVAVPFTGTSGTVARTPPPAPVKVSPLARAATTARAEAAAWIAGQVSGAAMIGCDPAMCAALQARGVAAGRLVPLRAGHADVVVTSPSADGRFADRYAPALIASFGSSSGRIEVRAIEPGGVAAYAAALRSDLAARKAAGSELLRNRHLSFSSQSAAQIRSGQVDSRLLATLAALAGRYRFRVTAFSDPGTPGTRQPFRQVTIRGAALHEELAMVRIQNPPYLPTRAGIVGGTVLSIEFAAPSPLGLLTRP